MQASPLGAFHATLTLWGGVGVVWGAGVGTGRGWGGRGAGPPVLGRPVAHRSWGPAPGGGPRPTLALGRGRPVRAPAAARGPPPPAHTRTARSAVGLAPRSRRWRWRSGPTPAGGGGAGGGDGGGDGGGWTAASRWLPGACRGAPPPRQPAAASGGAGQPPPRAQGTRAVPQGAPPRAVARRCGRGPGAWRPRACRRDTPGNDGPRRAAGGPGTAWEGMIWAAVTRADLRLWCGDCVLGLKKAAHRARGLLDAAIGEDAALRGALGARGGRAGQEGQERKGGLHGDGYG
jgi:hypothetical protein